MTTPAWRFCASLIENALAELSERAEKMSDISFLSEHAAAHDAGRSPTIDIVAAVLEREWWRRWPEGRDEDADDLAA